MDRNISKKNLEEVLCENVPDISGKKIWVWGTGDTAQLYQQGFKRLEKEGFFIEGYIDSFPEKRRTLFNGKPVIGPDELEKSADTCVLICSIRQEVVQELSVQLDGMNVEWHLMDEVILKMHRTEVLKCYDLMADEKSKNVFAGIIVWRVTGKKTEIETEQMSPYFGMDYFSDKNPEEIFIDCGAYIGDTLEDYLTQKNGIFNKIIAFEPDISNFERLTEQIEKECEKWKIPKDKITAYPYGVAQNGCKGKVQRYDANSGLGSKIVENLSEESDDCRIVSLDESLTEPYTFLKADIESYEYQMLSGAQKGIRKYKPLLAICLYHNSVDLYSIPLLVSEMLSEYKFAVRHYSDELSETIMYAWV